MPFALAAGVLSAAPLASAATLSNGSFEAPATFMGTFTTIDAVEAGIDNWTVESGSVDLINTYWVADNGRYSLDLSGNGPGVISQTVSDLVPGQSYRLSFSMAGNPDGGSPIKKLTASVGGKSGLFSFDTQSPTQTSRTNMGYEQKFLDFVATSDKEVVKFASEEDSAWGPALDNVEIAPIPVPASAPLLLAGLGGLALLRRRRRG
jgi:choice-of-anchor C domain-containing protein